MPLLRANVALALLSEDLITELAAGDVEAHCRQQYHTCTDSFRISHSFLAELQDLWQSRLFNRSHLFSASIQNFSIHNVCKFNYNAVYTIFSSADCPCRRSSITLIAAVPVSGPALQRARKRARWLNAINGSTTEL